MGRSAALESEPDTDRGEHYPDDGVDDAPPDRPAEVLSDRATSSAPGAASALESARLRLASASS